MFRNHNLYDRLRVCMVGRVWPPEFFNWIDDNLVKETLQKITKETEEDLLALVHLLESLGVEVIRPEISSNVNLLKHQIDNDLPVPPPPIAPGDYMVLSDYQFVESFSYGPHADIYNLLYKNLLDFIKQQGNNVLTVDNPAICAAMCYQFTDKIFYSKYDDQNHDTVREIWKKINPEKKIIGFHQSGHIDGWFCPLDHTLIVTAEDRQRPELMSLFFRTYFKDSVVLSRGPSYELDYSFKNWQKNNSSKWWLPGYKENYKFNEFIEKYFYNWIGDISETVFEINMIVVDKKTVIVKESENVEIIDFLCQHGITVYQTPMRHSTFWDAGVNCVTLALHRE